MPATPKPGDPAIFHQLVVARTLRHIAIRNRDRDLLP